MKIFEFHGGLGNQIFEYIYLKYLRKKYPQETFYSYFYDKKKWLHNGFELDKWFEVDIPPTNFFVNVIGFCCYQANRIIRHLPLHLPLMFTSNDVMLNDDKLFHQGWYQNKKYFKEVGAIDFKGNIVLNARNMSILQLMTKPNSVAVHVRRGDYLHPKNRKIVGGICTSEYYERAISTIKSIIDKPHFFFFSDDPQYVAEKYKDLDMTIIDWNKKEDSFYDMYLMAHASNMILANSTFSCIAAYLNNNANNVICPPVWNRKENPDLSLENWIVIDSTH